MKNPISLGEDLNFMKIALEEAFTAFHKDEVPIGAAIIYKKTVIARAHNLTETFGDITAHAEMLVIHLASHFLGKKYIRECTLYVTVEPCIMCAGALFWAQIGRVVCGTNSSKRGFLCTGIKLHPRTQFKSGIMKNKCRNILQKFFLLKRKI